MHNPENYKTLFIALCQYLPFELKGVVNVEAVDTNYVDMDGFYGETWFDADVELIDINADTKEIYVISAEDNEDLADYIQICQTDGEPWTVDDFKPYLRPMSSMTEEEEREVRILWNEDFADRVSLYHCYPRTTQFYCQHHLDYMGLIQAGIALEVKKGTYEEVH